MRGHPAHPNSKRGHPFFFLNFYHTMANRFTTELNALYDIQTINRQQVDELASITIKQGTRNGESEARLDEAGVAIYADTVPAPIPDANGRDGWYYSNTNGSPEKFNYYYFNGIQEIIQLGQISTLFSTVALDIYTGLGSIPFFHIYTKPTGVGDAGAFFHSRITFQAQAPVHVGIGERVLLYTNFENQASFFSPTARRVLLANKTVLGDGVDSEEILFITLSSSSATPAGEVRCLCEDLGFITTSLNNGLGIIRRQLKLTTAKAVEPYNLQVSKGQIVGSSSLYKFGFNADINGAEETIWSGGGLYPWLTGAITLYIIGSANDDVLGTGARKIIISGLNANYEEVEEEVEMLGILEAQSTNTYIRVNRVYVSEAGALGANDGIITLGLTGGGTSYAEIPAGDGQTQMALYTVPAGSTFYMNDVVFTCALSQAQKFATLKMRIREFGTGSWRTQFINVAQSNEFINDFKEPLRFEEKTDIELIASTNTNNNAIAGSFKGLIVKN